MVVGVLDELGLNVCLPLRHFIPFETILYVLFHSIHNMIDSLFVGVLLYTLQVYYLVYKQSYTSADYTFSPPIQLFPLGKSMHAHVDHIVASLLSMRLLPLPPHHL